MSRTLFGPRICVTNDIYESKSHVEFENYKDDIFTTTLQLITKTHYQQNLMLTEDLNSGLRLQTIHVKRIRFNRLFSTIERKKNPIKIQRAIIHESMILSLDKILLQIHLQPIDYISFRMFWSIHIHPIVFINIFNAPTKHT